MRKVQPLDIRTTLGDDEMASYQAPWSREQCDAALRTTNMYQAGGNLLWVSAAPAAVCPAPKMSWAQVRELQAMFFEPAGAKAKLAKNGRLVFPAILQAYVQDPGAMASAADAGDTALPLLGGHGLVMAWWAAMYDALRAAGGRAGDPATSANGTRQSAPGVGGAGQSVPGAGKSAPAAFARVAALWQCALTTTIQVRLEREPKSIIALSVAASEGLALSAKALTDNFLVFSEKLAQTEIKVEAAQLDAFKALTMRYNGALVNKTMLQAAALVSARVTPRCAQVLTEIEFAHGREVLTGAYNKIMRVLQQVDKASSFLGGPPEESLLFLLQAWQREFAKDPKTAKALSTDGIPAQVATILSRKWMRDEAEALVKDLQKLDKPPAVCAEFSTVLSWFADYDAFNAAFPAGSPVGKSAPVGGSGGGVGGEPPASEAEADEGEVEEQDDGDYDDQAAQDILATKKKNLGKHAGQLLELCYALYTGLGDKNLGDAVAKEGTLSKLPKLAEDGGGLIGDHFRSLRAAMASHRRIIAVEATAAPPPVATRVLKQWDSEASEAGGATRAQEEEDRQEVWRSAQALRRKSAAVVPWAFDTGAAGLNRLLVKPGPVRDFKGKAKEAHRAFIFSADLLAETAAEPWRELSDTAIEGPHPEALINWMLEQKGASDILIFADGRSRKARRVLEDALEKRQHVVEFWVLYSGGSSRICPGRNVSFGAANKEVILVALPCPRTQLRVKRREELFAACGEASTHWSCYSNVPGLPLKQMAKVAKSDKEAFFGGGVSLPAPPETLADGLNDSVPLFWQERKSAKFWLQFLSDLDIRCVVDCTPGSGVLAAACLEEGLPYLGVGRNAAQATFLQNRMDRDSLAIIAKTNTALYQEDLAAQVRRHFADIVEEGTAAGDAADETDAEESDLDTEEGEEEVHHARGKEAKKAKAGAKSSKIRKAKA